MVQWYRMDTWDQTPLVGTMGLPQDVPPVPNGTMVWDGHLGFSPSGWYNGIILGCPTCTKRYNGTGWTLGIQPLLLVQWNYPRIPHLYQWYIEITKLPNGHPAASLDNPQLLCELAYLKNCRSGLGFLNPGQHVVNHSIHFIYLSLLILYRS